MTIRFLSGDFTGCPGKTNRQAITEVMYRIGQDRHTIGQQTADYFNQGKTEVQPERSGDILTFMMMVVMVVRHAWLRSG